jgi:triosephosphate isomerase (TIM)
MRHKLIAANWKLNPTSRLEAISLVEGVKSGIRKDRPPILDILLCPPALYLGLVQSVLIGSEFKLGAQNCYLEEKGAFTGELSPLMLAEFGVNHVIIGHSERRTIFGETDELVNAKVLAAIKNNLVPILCLGETLAQREANETDELIILQITKSLAGAKLSGKNLVIAYEPVWAIGTGKTCSSEEANRVCKLIRSQIAKLYGEDIANLTLILYGGSVKANTIEEQIKQSDIDGALVGGASLQVDEFVGLVSKAALAIE